MAGPVVAGASHPAISVVVGEFLSRVSEGAPGLAGGSSTSVTAMAICAESSAEGSALPAASTPSLTVTVTV